MIFNKKIKIILILMFSLFITNAFASVVKIVKNKDGVWKMLVDYKPYFVKGICYSADRVGVGSTVSNSWMWSDVDGNGKIDGPYDSWVDLNRDNFQDSYEDAIGDFALLKAMGCNTIRIYDSENVNKELLRDLYNVYGIRVIMGNYLGAYTKGSGASWASGTDYSNEKQRQSMLESGRKMVEEHKDEPHA